MSDRANLEVRYEFKAGGIEFDLLSFTIDEGLSTPFCGEFKLASFQSQIPVEQMLNQRGTLKIYQNKQLTRIFSGIVQSFEKGDEGGQDNRYNMTLVPEFARLSLRHNSRIFQHKSVIDILEIMLKEMHITDYDLRMMNPHEEREYCVQYRETDLAFLHRILAEEGITYFFDYDEEKDYLTFNDYTPRALIVEGDVHYDAISSAVPDYPHIRRFLLQNEIAPTSAILAEYHFRAPDFAIAQRELGRETDLQNGDYEHYDYPGRYRSNNVGRIFTKARLNYLRRDSTTALGKGDVASFKPGFYFEFKKQYYVDYNKPWLLTHVRHIGTQPQSLEAWGAMTKGVATYHNEFSVMPKALPWSPMPEPKPQVGGPNVAVVTGPPDEEIYVDEYGRVKVKFKWDRKQTPEPKDYDRTCWIRVSDGWAGAGRGMVAVPRVGDEVLVSFLEGNPDRPIITGRTYHAHNRHPYALPAHKTITGIRTQTHRGDGYNELYFDDENEKQLVRIHAEKDYDLKVKNVKNERIDFDHQVSIGNDEKIDVANDRVITVEGEQHYSTKGNHIELREADSSLEIKGDLIEKVAGTHGLRVDGDLTLESMSRLTLKVGGNFVVIDSSGVYINGPIVTVNSGGTPGDTVVPQVPTILDVAAENGKPFVASCPLQDKSEKKSDYIERFMSFFQSESGSTSNATDVQDGLLGLDTSFLPNSDSQYQNDIGTLVDNLGSNGALQNMMNGVTAYVDSHIPPATRVLTESLSILNTINSVKEDPKNLSKFIGFNYE